MMDLKIYCEEPVYKNGKVVVKYYILHPDIPVRIYLKPIDKTAEEMMYQLVAEKKIKEWEIPSYFEEE